MNILIPDSWLKEFLDTKASPKQIARHLSLSSQSVEKLIAAGQDWVYDIEITTNRPDCLSVYGIARELAAILPRQQLQARLEPILKTKVDFPPVEKSLPLKVEIKDQSLCPRFTALVFDQVKIRPSPKVVQDRLEKAGTRALNNVVDISNYLMIELGQPMHTFDYDKILKAKMVLRESKKGEKLVTLDDQVRELPPGTIVIEDGSGRLIDLCGIMGGKNSEVDQNTKRVLLFVQTYDPTRIRRTCQQMAFRSEASARFEKGVEPEGVIPAMKKALLMFQENCHARVAGNLIDLYPKPHHPRQVTLTQKKLDQITGIRIKLSQAREILENLGFDSSLSSGQKQLTVIVPAWRNSDVNIPEDLVEEVARIYGYHNFPGALPAGEIPQETGQKLNFSFEDQAKDILQGLGLFEIVTYSPVSAKKISQIGYQPQKYLEIANPLSLEWQYLRPSLIPSILEAVALNQARREKFGIFELSHIYLPRGKSKLPEERSALVIALAGSDYLKIKGNVEVLLTGLNIESTEFSGYDQGSAKSSLWHPTKTALISSQNRRLGIVGEVNLGALDLLGIEKKVVLAEIDFEALLKRIGPIKKFRLVPKFPAITQDLTFVVKPKTPVGQMTDLIKDLDPLVDRVEFLKAFENARSFRVTFRSSKRTLTDKEVEKIRKKIIDQIGKKFAAKLKRKP